MIKNLLVKSFLVCLFFSFSFSFAIASEKEEIKKDFQEIKERVYEIERDTHIIIDGKEDILASFPRIPSDFRFAETTPIRYEDYGKEVFYMQIILNADPQTRLAESGIGSPGKEVKRFGNITKNAVKKFQEKYKEEILHPWGITEPTGIAAIQTQKKLNKILEGEVVIKLSKREKLLEIKRELLLILEDIIKLREKIDDYEKSTDPDDDTDDDDSDPDPIEPDDDDPEDPEEPEGAEDAPQNFQARVIAYGEVLLTWDKDEDVQRYVAYKGKASRDYEMYGHTTKDYGIISGLEYKETYYMAVTQIVDGKESGYSREIKITMNLEPTPFNLQTKEAKIKNQQATIVLEWETDRGGIEQYNIYRSLNHEGPYNKVGVSTKEEFMDMGVGMQAIYYYVVTQVIDGKESEYSGEHVDSWYNATGPKQYPHPKKEDILRDLD